MLELERNERYVIDNFKAKSLENNPLGSPVNRDLRIYLPPDYFNSGEKRYPVIYFLHGYGNNNKSWSITSANEPDRALPVDRIPKKLLTQVYLDRIPTYELLDELINKGELKPFILVQPDASLHIHNINGTKDLSGKVSTKGSFYINSPFTGNYMDYIVEDVIQFVDSKYRTIPDKEHRALTGASMGAAGTLRICIFHPEKFIAAVALSPGNIVRELLNWEVDIPLIRKYLGKRISKKRGKKVWNDILDTHDLIFSKDNRLLPSIKQDKNGGIIDVNEEALKRWMEHDIRKLIENNPNALKSMHLMLNVDRNDEMGSAIATRGIHETLEKLKIPHEYEMYDEPKAWLSPHILGIAYHGIPAFQFCVQYIN